MSVNQTLVLLNRYVFMRRCLAEWADVKEWQNEKFDFLYKQKEQSWNSILTNQNTAQWTVTRRQESILRKVVLMIVDQRMSSRFR